MSLIRKNRSVEKRKEESNANGERDEEKRMCTEKKVNEKREGMWGTKSKKKDKRKIIMHKMVQQD